MKKDLNGFFQIRKKYHLYIKGLYKVKVYPNKIGTYIEAIQLEEDLLQMRNHLFLNIVPFEGQE